MLGGAETSNLHWESEIGNWQCVGMSLISPQSSEERYLKDYLIGKNLRLYHLLIDIYSFYVVIDLFSIFCPWLTLKRDDLNDIWFIYVCFEVWRRGWRHLNVNLCFRMSICVGCVVAATWQWRHNTQQRHEGLVLVLVHRAGYVTGFGSVGRWCPARRDEAQTTTIETSSCE